MNTEIINQGDTWKPKIAVKKIDALTLVESAFNCEGYTAYLIMKKGVNETLPEISRLIVAWTAQSSGAGYFTLPNSVTKTLHPIRYAYEVKLQKDDSSELITINQGYLTVLPALKKDYI